MLEPLESRIAPATFVNANVVTYTDIDGDHVTIISSLPIFSNGTSGNANSILHFSAGSVNGSNTTPQQLQLVDLTGLSSQQVAGDSISITAVKAGGGDGYVNVGYIDSSYALGNVTVHGDLGRIDAGLFGDAPVNYIGLSSLNVHSLGAQGTLTQASGGNLLSTINGSIGSITVQQDMINAQIVAASNSIGLVSNGNIGSVYIGGNLSGTVNGTDSNNNPVTAGNITTSGNVGSVVIVGSMLGGSGSGTASLTIGGKLGALVVDGSIIGYHDATGNTTGQGAGSASVITGNNFPASGGIGSVTVRGSVTGGDGAGSAEFTNASITSGGNFGPIYIGGSLTGGSGSNSGEFVNTEGVIGPVTIVGSLTGGSGQDSGEINGVALSSIYIGHGIAGSSGINSGLITSENGIGAIAIMSGGISGGTAADAGAILAGTSPSTHFAQGIPSILIYGDVTSTAPSGSLAALTPGQINAAVPIGYLTIYGSLVGTAGDYSGAIIDSGVIGHVALLPHGTSDGSILGGAGNSSGEISAFSFGSVYVAGRIAGAAGAGSGFLFASDNVGSIVAKSLTSGSGAASGQISVGGNLTGLEFTGAAAGQPTMTGAVYVTGNVGAIYVKGSVTGSGDNTGLFNIGEAIGSFTITGALQGGSGLDSGSIFAGLDGTSRIGGIDIAGGIFGGGGLGSGELFSGGGINAAVLGDVIGGGNQYSGSVVTDGPIGNVVLTGVSTNPTHGLIGSTGEYSGVISAGSTLGSVRIYGGIAGNSGTGSGAIVSNSIFSPSGDIQGNISAIIITGSLTGGTGANSGQIAAAGNLAGLYIGGNVSGAGAAILAGVQPTSTAGGSIGGVKIIGTVSGGEIAAGGSISSLIVAGGIQGQASSPVTISAVGPATPGKLNLAFGDIWVGGSVADTNILAGYDQYGNPVNGAASIYSVVVNGSWSGSNLVAGVLAANGNFGDPNATLITSSASVVPTIAAIVIKGNVESATPPGAANTYGFVAEKIDALYVDGHAQAFAMNVVQNVDGAQDTDAREVTALSPV
jgi:hypothetical protein